MHWCLRELNENNFVITDSNLSDNQRLLSDLTVLNNFFKINNLHTVVALINYIMFHVSRAYYGKLALKYVNNFIYEGYITKNKSIVEKTSKLDRTVAVLESNVSNFLLERTKRWEREFQMQNKE